MKALTCYALPGANQWLPADIAAHWGKYPAEAPIQSQRKWRPLDTTKNQSRQIEPTQKI